MLAETITHILVLVASIAAILFASLPAITCSSDLNKHLKNIENEIEIDDLSPNELDGDAGFGCQANWNFDHFKMAISWAPGACQTRLKCVPSTKPGFIIHGLWPSQWNGDSPVFCCDRQYFDRRLLSNIDIPLSRAMPNVNGGPLGHFWGSQWKKHGTCATKHTQVNTIPKFFNVALRIFQRLNLLEVLHHYEIDPSDSRTYSSSSIAEAISQEVGASVQVNCSPSNHGGNKVVFDEVRICLDLNFQPIDCRRGKKCRPQVVFPKTIR